MAKGKVFHSFADLAAATRFEASKNKGGGKPKPVPPPQPVVADHAPKPKVKGRVNARRR